MSGFDLTLALDACQMNLFGRIARRGFRVHLLGFIYDDALEFLFLIKEIRHVKEGVAVESDIDKGRLHTRQHAHYAAFIDVADDSLVLFASLDVELSDAFVFDDSDFLFTSIDAND